MIRMIDPKKQEKKDNPFALDIRSLHESEYLQVKQITLLPGERMRKHVSPVETFFYILEGKGMVEIGDERMEVSSEMFIEGPAYLAHGFLNEGQKPFRFLIFKIIRPKKGISPGFPEP